MCPSSFRPCWNFVVQVLHRVFSRSHGYYEFICTTALPCLGDTLSSRFRTAAGLQSLLPVVSSWGDCDEEIVYGDWGDFASSLCLQRAEFCENETLSKDWNLQFWSRAKLSLVQLSNCPKPHSEKWHNFDHNEQKFGRKHNLFLDFRVSV